MLRATFGMGALTLVMAGWMSVVRLPAMRRDGLTLRDGAHTSIRGTHCVLRRLAGIIVVRQIKGTREPQFLEAKRHFEMIRKRILPVGCLTLHFKLPRREADQTHRFAT